MEKLSRKLEKSLQKQIDLRVKHKYSLKMLRIEYQCYSQGIKQKMRNAKVTLSNLKNFRIRKLNGQKKK